ncbi:MAG: UDP-N-acetylmuramoyl-L-alanine--D-glutamate ligase, partial [Proteobacteria bacterium]
VLELSSYQLENWSALKLEHAAITFLSPNHLERYDSLDDYYMTKWRIVDQTAGKLFLNKNGGELLEFAQKQPEFNRCVVCSKEAKALQPLALSHAELLGTHNQDNIALSAEIALHCHWPISAIAGMKAFKGLEHRLENMGQIKGIRFINDSKATAMDSVLTAAQVSHEALSADGNLVVLLGGRNKNLPWDELSLLGRLSRTSFVFFGECREIAQNKSKLAGSSYENLNDALTATFPKLKKNDTLLFSPGGTSLDEFKGFEDRGRFFKHKVKSHYE